MELSLGGHTDHLHGEPLAVTAKVRALSDGRYENPSDMPTHGGARYFDAGLCGMIAPPTTMYIIMKCVLALDVATFKLEIVVLLTNHDLF